MASGPGGRPVLGALACAMATLALASAMACSSESPPPRSPIGADTATAAPTLTSSATARPSVTARPSATPLAAPGTPVVVDRELAIGKAIERMAQWLGLDQTDLSFDSAAEQAFPDACLGIARPGVACAEVVTPGVSVVLRDRFDHPHEVRADAILQTFGWAPQVTAGGTVVTLDATAGTLSIDAGGTTLELRNAPGTLQGSPLAALRPGTAVAVAFDQSPLPNQANVIVWIATD